MLLYSRFFSCQHFFEEQVIHVCDRLPEKEFGEVCGGGFRRSVDSLTLDSEFGEQLVLLRKESLDENFTYLVESNEILDVEGLFQFLFSFLKSVFLFPLLARQEFENQDR